MIKIKTEDIHHFSSKFIGSIENHIKSVFGVKPLNSPSSAVDKIKALFLPKYDGNKIKEFLKKLDVFSEITEVSNIFYAKEKKSNISIKSKLNENNTFETVANLCFPNVYGSGESINFECLPLKGFQLLFKKPIVTEKTLSFFELKVFQEMKKLNDKKYNTRGLCVSQTTKNFSIGFRKEILNDKSFNSSFLNYNTKGYNLSINAGFISLSPFLKVTSGFNHKFCWNRFYLKSDLKCGIIKGKSHPTTRFSIGNTSGYSIGNTGYSIGNTSGYSIGNTSGYKEGSNVLTNGGRSFLEVNNEVGMKFGNLNLFVRKNLGFNSNKNKFWGILAEMKELIPAVKENVGIGIGFSYLLGGVNVGVAYTPKEGDNKYVLIFDAEM